VVHDPRWSGGLGRLFVIVDATDITQAAGRMLQLMEITRDEVGRLLTDL
jgi:hypothetical protein